MQPEQLNDLQKIKIMQETVKPIVDFLEERIKSRRSVLDTLIIQPIDTVPESIKKMREVEARQIRAIVQEQEDILFTIKALYPNG